MKTHPTSTNTRVCAVIFDISGTVLEYGSRAPALAFIELFASQGVMVTEAEARGPMGLHKADHIRTLLANPAVAARWETATGAMPAPGLVEKLYANFSPLQKEVVARHCDIIPGVPEVVAALRERGIAIANTTGFDTDMIEELKKLAKVGGYEPDLWVCADQVGQGRPAPWMIFYAAKQLGIYPLGTFVKVGDTLSDIAEAQAVGVWSVRVVRHGNEMGLSPTELDALPPDELAERLAAASARFKASGAHYVIDGTCNLLPVIDDISARIGRSEKP